MESYEEFMAKSDEELVAAYNVSKNNATRTTSQWYLDELSRRRTDRATDALVQLTKRLTWLTVAIAVLTAVGAAASIIAAFNA
jgi:hypothetical protein